VTSISSCRHHHQTTFVIWAQSILQLPVEQMQYHEQVQCMREYNWMNIICLSVIIRERVESQNISLHPDHFSVHHITILSNPMNLQIYVATSVRRDTLLYNHVNHALFYYSNKRSQIKSADCDHAFGYGCQFQSYCTR
jgi:hypothetical protein